MWTVDVVAARFAEAAQTAERLPPVGVRGYFNTWPALLREPWARYAAEDGLSHLPPEPSAIDRLEETLRWVRWLSEPQRHLVWMRARDCPWRAICQRFGCDRTTAWRRWQHALGLVAGHLNESVKPSRPHLA
jgi:hypothetical protein